MRLLRENASQIEVLTENTSSGRKLYLEGKFLMSNALNRNGRFYPKPVMEQAVDMYKREYIDESRAIGELNHPDRPFADPKHAAIFIESLTWQGDDVVGKARVLNNPDGDRIKSLLEAGFKFGVSSRGLGDVVKESQRDLVNKFLLTAIDTVDKPSGQVCYVNPVNESVEWVYENGVWHPSKAIAEMLAKKKPSEDELFEGFCKLVAHFKQTT